MHYAVNYRLRADQADRDQALLRAVYEELATLQLPWLACESYELDDRHSMMFLIELERIDRLAQAPLLSAYLGDLADRCEGEPRAGVVERGGIDVSAAHERGRWVPSER